MKRMAFLYAILVVVIIVLADVRHLGFLYAIYDFPFGDKVGHFFLFGGLSLIVNLVRLGSFAPSVMSNNSGKNVTSKVVTTSFVLALLVGLEEFSQRWFPSRTSDLLDLSASYLGIAFFAFIAWKIDIGRSRLK